MLRVIRSTVQGLDINLDQAEAFEEAIEAFDTSANLLRETYSTDGIGQKEVHYRVIAYTDPNAEHRFAILLDEPSEIDWQDTDSYDEALQAYEECIRETAAGLDPRIEQTEDGEQEVPPFDFTDVPGIDGYEDGAEEAGNAEGRILQAQWLNIRYESAVAAVKELEAPRRVAIGRAVEEFGRGGQSVVGRRLDLSQPTVRDLAERGLAEWKAAQTA